CAALGRGAVPGEVALVGGRARGGRPTHALREGAAAASVAGRARVAVVARRPGGLPAPAQAALEGIAARGGAARARRRPARERLADPRETRVTARAEREHRR